MRIVGVVNRPKKPWLDPDFQPNPCLSYLASEWDRLFKLRWVEFRHELALIGDRQRATISGVEWDVTPNEGDLVLPIDDDDWLNPATPEIIQRRMREHPSVTCLIWQSWKLTETGLAKNQNDYLCMASHAWVHRESRADWSINHTIAEPGFRAEGLLGWLNHPSVLLLWNNTPASETAFLYRAVRPFRLRQLVDRAVQTHREFLASAPQSIRWAVPQITEQLGLLRRL